MKKNSIRNYIVLAVILVVFSVIAFCLPLPKNGVFAAGYIFGLIAIVAQLYFLSVAFSKGGDAKSRFYGFPIARIGVVYLILQLILSLIEIIFAAAIPMWIVIIVDVLVAALAFLGSVAAETMKEEIERQDTKLKKDVSSMRELQSLANAVMNQCDDDSVKGELRKISDELKYSDPVSSDATAPLEKEIHGQLEEIQKAVIDGDTSAVKAMSGKLLSNLTERNRICKLNK